MLPTGDWHCPNCTCKLCGMAGSSIAQGNEITACTQPTCSLCEKKCIYYHLPYKMCLYVFYVLL